MSEEEKLNEPLYLKNLMNDLIGESKFLEEDLYTDGTSSSHHFENTNPESDYIEMNNKILNIDPRSLDILRQKDEPSKDIRKIIKSVLLTLKLSEESESWENCKEKLTIYSDDGILSKIRDKTIIDAKDNDYGKISELLREVDLKSVKRESIGAAALYAWNKSVMHYVEHCSGEDTEESLA